MSTETFLVRRIRDWLRKDCGCFVIKFHGGPFMMAGLPDLLALLPQEHQRFPVPLFLEVKIWPNTATRLQKHIMRLLQKVGAPAHVVFSLSDVQRIVKGLLNETIVDDL